MQDVMVRTRADFDRLPEDGLWEVVDGRAILLPANDNEHQRISVALLLALHKGLESLGYGEVLPTVNVFIPRPKGAWGEVQNRVPDLVVSKYRPQERFEVGQPPELVIEILSTRRGNVERTEKLDDYARAGIGEYWIVNPFDRAIEVYAMRQGEYALRETVSQGSLSPAAFPGVQLDLKEIWAVLK
jgi:Uma2 family endonuclease